MDTLECYKTLDLEPGATAEQVRESYLGLAHVWDPQRFVNNPLLREKAVEKMREIEDAYRSLQAFLPDLHPLAQQAGAPAAQRPSDALEQLASGDEALPRWALTGFVLLLILGTLALALGLLLKTGHSAPMDVP